MISVIVGLTPIAASAISFDNGLLVGQYQISQAKHHHNHTPGGHRHRNHKGEPWTR